MYMCARVGVGSRCVHVCLCMCGVYLFTCVLVYVRCLVCTCVLVYVRCLGVYMCAHVCVVSRCVHVCSCMCGV